MTELSVPTFKQREVRILLEELVSKVQEYEDKHNAAYEAAKANLTSASEPLSVDAYGRKMDYHEHVRTEIHMMRLDLKLILERSGVGGA